jgi:hypothetical protein
MRPTGSGLQVVCNRASLSRWRDRGLATAADVVKRMHAARKAQAAQFAANVLPIIRASRRQGHNRLNAITGQLTLGR